MEVTIWSDIHESSQRTVMVISQQAIPFTTPDNFDDVPSGSTEEAFEFLNNLAVTANGAIQTLQVSVNDEVEVI